MGVKSKSTVGIRYNVKYYEIAVAKSGLSSLQQLFDFLLEKYVFDDFQLNVPQKKIEPNEQNNNKKIKEILPPSTNIQEEVNNNFPDFLKPRVSRAEIESLNKKFLEEQENPVYVRFEEKSDIENLPQWTPPPKPEKTAANVEKEVEDFAAKEMERLRALQERAKKIKSKK